MNGQLTTQAGPAGKVNINATQTLSLEMGGSISSTASTSAGGDVNIQTPVLTISGGSVISSSALEAGKVSIVSPSITLSSNSAISTDTQQPNPAGTADVTLDTTTLSLDNSKVTALTTGPAAGGAITIGPMAAGGANPAVTLTAGSVIAADTKSSGPSGSVTLQVAALSMDGTSLISASNIGAGMPGIDGAAGSVVIVADTSITLDHNSQIATNGGILGVPGFVQVQAQSVTMQNGSLVTDDVTSPDRTGAMQSAIGFAVGALSMDTNSQISAGTEGAADGGRIAIGPINASSAWPVVSIAGASNITAGTGATATGSAGDITIQSSNFTATDSLVQSSNLGTGPAGGIQIQSMSDISISNSTLTVSAASNSAGRLLVAALGNINVAESKITAVSSGTGLGGTVTFSPPPTTTGSLPAVILSGGTIVSADTTASGPGGSVLMNVASLAMDQSTISASNAGTGAPGTDGTAGSVVVMTPAAGIVTLNHNSHIATDGGYTGAAGDIQITAAKVSLSDASSITNNVESPADAAASQSAVGIATSQLSMTNGSTLSAGTTGTGAGGRIAIGPFKPASPWPIIAIDSGSGISASSSPNSSGVAGDFTLHAENLSLDKGTIQTQSDGTGAAGGMSIASRTNVRMIDSTLSVKAMHNNGGDLSVGAPDLIHLTDSSILASAANTGGKITIDPSLVVLDDGSVINGLAGGKQQPVTIGASGFLLSPTSQVLTNQPQFAVDTTIASTIGRLAGGVESPGITLADQCGVYFSDDVISSFVVTGRGGTPVEPGGWSPSLELSNSTPEDDANRDLHRRAR